MQHSTGGATVANRARRMRFGAPRAGYEGTGMSRSTGERKRKKERENTENAPSIPTGPRAGVTCNQAPEVHAARPWEYLEGDGLGPLGVVHCAILVDVEPGPGRGGIRPTGRGGA